MTLCMTLCMTPRMTLYCTEFCRSCFFLALRHFVGVILERHCSVGFADSTLGCGFVDIEYRIRIEGFAIDRHLLSQSHEHVARNGHAEHMHVKLVCQFFLAAHPSQRANYSKDQV